MEKKVEELKDEELKAEELKDEKLKGEELKAEELKDEDLKAEELKDEKLKDEELKAEDLKDEELKAEELKDEDLKPEELKDEKLKYEELKADELKDEDLKAEELKDEKLKDEELKDDELKDEELKAKELKDEDLKPEELKDEKLKAKELKDEDLKPEELKDEKLKDEELKAEELKDDELKTEDLKDDELKDEVKSTAVVKYSVPRPTNFLTLKCNTDLKLTPSNWLSDAQSKSYGLQHTLYEHREFSSFRMAHLFPDCIGEVDVVSDAENIKNLLKIPYNKRHISMVVHRVGNSLLLDNFDIYKHLLKSTEDDWAWLHKFFIETVERSILNEAGCLYAKTKKIKAIKERNLKSKFLYHSLAENGEDHDNSVSDYKADILPPENPVLPEPDEKDKVPDPLSFEHTYKRNVVWTFEDIEMLIGTDMPIFGGGTHPCISLRLRDMSKPISVLTGIDYWLDNLMSNVPEVVMCFHLNGIVQKYELVKTEDLPKFPKSKFSPNLIRDVAQSILSFLKTNATRAGHTYWLFKGKDEEVVKLYDLTSLGAPDDNDQNPFTVPVAMLLYRVARNMKHSKDSYQPGTIRLLLKNCIKLLSGVKYPEIVTSSHYMLSDLYIPVETNPENPILEDEVMEDRDYFFQDDDDEKVEEDPLKFLLLNSNKYDEKGQNHFRPPPPVTGSVEERCLQSLQHVVEGLTLLQYFKTDTSEDVPMANPSEPIPMPFSKTNEEPKDVRKKKKKDKGKKNSGAKEPNSLLPKNNADTQPLPTWQDSQKSINWKDHLKILLYEKIVLDYAVLSESHYKLERYGDCLRCLGILFRAILIVNKLTPLGCSLKLNCLYERAGDCFLMIVHNWKKCDGFRSQLNMLKEEDEKILDQIKLDERYYHINLLQCNFKCIAIYDIRTIEQILINSLACYEEASKLVSSKVIARRLGNSLNEIGSYYLNQAKSSNCNNTIKEFCMKSGPFLKRAADIFDKDKDIPNTALINANIGHLHRLMAYGNANKEKIEVSLKERSHFKKALHHYNKSIFILGERELYPGIWDAVNWEISTTYFTLAITLQDNMTDKNFQDIEKETIDLLHKALSHCHVEVSDPSMCTPQQVRTGNINYRLASLYHGKVLTVSTSDARRRCLVLQSNIHYTKAAEMYEQVMDAVNYLTSQMQKFALSEWFADLSEATVTKLKHFKSCLDVILETKKIISLLAEGKISVEDSDIAQFDIKEKNLANLNSVRTLLLFIKQKIQHVLKNLVKLSMTQIQKDGDLLLTRYKSCYNDTFKLDSCCDFYEFLKLLSRTLQLITDRLNFDVE